MANIIPSLFKGLVHIKGCIDSVVEDQRFGPLGDFLVGREQFPEHAVCTVKLVRGFYGIVTINAQFKGA